ncbi:MAG: tryptophan synthase subunit alpha [Gemmatimonadales bacterium]|nr:tryptophan synthase subunit alpha [Gemmatimonadales bacterium]MDQ3427504.1 tryptophan synthase subunit alpha [Gemmatimonadota bacterium]
MSELRLAPVWADLQSRKRAALIPYLTAGYPTPRDSADALRAAGEVCDIIEVGVPFSDPLADGPTIQRSTFEALRQGMSLGGTLELVARADLTRPVVVFSYLNPILRYGVDRFLREAEGLGIAGLILTDLPAGSDPEVESAVQGSRLDLIRLIAPTTRAERLATAVVGAQGFVYLVARLGVTGATADLAAGLGASVARVRQATPLPVAVGFGISTPQQAAAVARLADGVVVGSRLVELLGSGGVAGARRFLGELRQALDQEDATR